MVVPGGNAPASSGYQPGALLLSYRTVLISGFNPNPTDRNTKVTFGAERIGMTRFGLKFLRTRNLLLISNHGPSFQNRVEQGLNECKGTVFHRASLGLIVGGRRR